MTKLARQFLAEASYRCGSTKRLDSRFFAAIAEKDVFRAQWGYWQNRLGITDPSVVSALADGAYWIWDAAFLEFSGVAQENPDIYHALEYLSNKGDALFGKETAESKIWLETMRRDLLDWGVKPVLDRVRLMASMEQLDGNKELLRVLENYLVFHSCRMNYRERLAEGKSIGSGQVEGACKNFSIFDTTKVETDRREVGSCTGGPHGGVVCRPLRRTVEGLLEQCCLAAHKVLLPPLSWVRAKALARLGGMGKIRGVDFSLTSIHQGNPMPRHDQTPEQIEAETDRLLLEQAQAFVRDLRAAAQNAPYGKIVDRADAFALRHGREFTRLALETIVQEQNDLLEKKTKQSGVTAAEAGNISDTKPDKP